MSGGGGGGGAQYPAPVLAGLWQGSNMAFQPLPYPGTGQAAGSALGSIGQYPTATYTGAPGASGLGAQLTGVGSSLLGGQYPQAAANYGALSDYAGQALNTAFDPQRALYAKLFQQQQDQNAASLSMSGVGTTPYGAGLMQQGNQNFDIAWQQAQLANQAQGAGTAEGLLASGVGGLQGILGAAGQAGTTGMNLGMAPTQLANQQQQQQIQDYLAYLASSTANAQAWANAVNQNYGAANQQYGTMVNQSLGQQQLNNQAFGGLGSLFGQFTGAGLQGAGPLSFLGAGAAA